MALLVANVVPSGGRTTGRFDRQITALGCFAGISSIKRNYLTHDRVNQLHCATVRVGIPFVPVLPGQSCFYGV